MFTFKEKVSIDCDELIKTDLTCPICSETYNQSDRLPKLLNRCHTICQSCLEGIGTRSDTVSKCSFPCPICRRKIDIPAGGLTKFQTDPYLNQLLDRIDDREVIPECPKHPLEELQYCEPCDALFCDSCEDKSHCNNNLSNPRPSTRRFSLAMKRKSESLSCETDKWISQLDDADKRLAFVEKKIKEKSAEALEENDLFFAKMSNLLDKRYQEVSVSIRKIRDEKLKTLHDQKKWIIDEKAKVTAGFKRFKHQGAIGEVKKKIENLQERAESKKDWLIPKENCFFRYVEKKRVVDSVRKVIEEHSGFRTSNTLPSLCEARIGKCFAGIYTLVTIVTKDFSGNKYYGHDLDAISAVVSCLKGSMSSINLKIYDRGCGDYETKFILSKPGTYCLKVTIFDCPIRNYPLEFEAKSWTNSNDSNDICDVFRKYTNRTPRDYVKLTANQKEVEIGSHGWTVGTEHTPPLEPIICRPQDASKIECAASVDCSKSTWICGGNSIRRVSLDEKKENTFSLGSNLNCIALVPGYSLSSGCCDVNLINAKQNTTCFIKEDISINEARSEATLRLEIENLSLNKSFISFPDFVRNLPWRISAKLSESSKELEVYLQCDGCQFPTWSCRAEAELKLIHQNGGESMTRKIDQVFKHDSENWGFRPFANWNDILDQQKGFIKDDSIILEVWMSADKPQGVSEDFVDDIGYVPLKERAITSASVFSSLSSSGRVNVANEGKESLLNQHSNKIAECDTNSNLMARLTQQNSSSTSLELTRKRDIAVQTLRTVWLGGDDGTLYILSAEDQSVYSCIKMKLSDSVVHIVHSRGKVFVALANGYCCVFIRSPRTLCWSLSEYFLLNITKMGSEVKKILPTEEQAPSITSIYAEISEESTSSKDVLSTVEQNFNVNCMEAVGASIWLACQDSIHILDCETLGIIYQFVVDEEAQIDKLTTTERGVWCSYQSQSNQMIQLFSATKPYGKVSSIDIRPDLRKMLIPSLSDSELDSVARITALKATNERLWVGTAAGIILNIPFRLTSRPYKSECNISQAQLSLHGFGRAVKFFSQLKNGMMSGGQGYRDLIIDPDAGANCVFDEYFPHMIVWKEKE